MDLGTHRESAPRDVLGYTPVAKTPIQSILLHLLQVRHLQTAPETCVCVSRTELVLPCLTLMEWTCSSLQSLLIVK